MEITKVKNSKGITVYHVVDGGCIQEFWSLRLASEFVEHFNKGTKATLVEVA